MAGEQIAARRGTYAHWNEVLRDIELTELIVTESDMWEPYIGATREGLPNRSEKIVFDRFHILREMTKAVDTVRKQDIGSSCARGTTRP